MDTGLSHAQLSWESPEYDHDQGLEGAASPTLAPTAPDKDFCYYIHTASSPASWGYTCISTYLHLLNGIVLAGMFM